MSCMIPTFRTFLAELTGFPAPRPGCVHDWSVKGLRDSQRPAKTKLICAKCRGVTTVGHLEAAARLAAGQRHAAVVWTYARGYDEGQADRKRGVQADIPFHAPHLAKRHQEQWMQGYRDGWQGMAKRS